MKLIIHAIIGNVIFWAFNEPVIAIGYLTGSLVWTSIENWEKRK